MTSIGKTTRSSGLNSAELMEHRCAISVIVPVYNTEEFLRECIDSILNQTFRDIELICVDDGSTDQSLLILRDYERADSRVKVFEQPHAGQSVARNFGIDMAGGKYIYFVDSDDILADGALETMYALIEERDVDILYFDGANFFETEEISKAFPDYSTCFRRPISYREVVSGADMFARMYNDKAYEVVIYLQIIKRDFLKATGVRFYKGVIHQDNIYTLETILQARRVSHENVVLYLRRVRSGSAITSAITYRNFAGCFIGWERTMSFILSHQFSARVRKSLKRRSRYMRSRTIEEGAAISDEEIRANMKNESLYFRSIYNVVFCMAIRRRRRRIAGAQENVLSKVIQKTWDIVLYRMGFLMIFVYDRLKLSFHP